jgi:hypothetical protein
VACMSLLDRCNVHVYEESTSRQFLSKGFRRIASFDYSEKPQNYPTIRVLCRGEGHYGMLKQYLVNCICWLIYSH